MALSFFKKLVCTGGTKDDSNLLNTAFTAKCNVTYGLTCPAGLQVANIALSDFKIIRAIGHGYASTVFEAIHHRSKLKCVLKVCMKTRLHHDEEKRLRREVNIHSIIEHPHILNMYAAFEDSRAFYIILEYAKHGDLASYIKNKCNGSLKLSDMRSFVLEPLLMAVKYLHSHNIIHRDIKPENILICEKHRIKLCDFGFSINSYDERPMSLIGTLEYMPPEIVEGKHYLFSEKIDIWAIGILLYECLTGISPFFMSSDSAIAQAIVQGKYTIPTHFSHDIISFLKACIHPNPAERLSAIELLRHPLMSRDHDDVVIVPGRRSLSYSM
jgi:serine/threonine protein kinase